MRRRRVARRFMAGRRAGAVSLARDWFGRHCALPPRSRAVLAVFVRHMLHRAYSGVWSTRHGLTLFTPGYACGGRDRHRGFLSGDLQGGHPDGHQAQTSPERLLVIQGIAIVLTP